MSRSGTSLDATLGSLQRTAAALAIGTLDDARAQRWLALRLPAACRPRDRMTLFPSPFGTPLTPWGIENEYQPDHSCYADHPVFRDALARSEGSDRTVVAGYLRGESVVTYAGNSVPPTLEVVTDWLNGLSEDDPRFLDKLPRVTWAHAEARAARWHERMLAQRVDRVAGDQGTVDRLDVHVLPGWHWIHLVTERALDAEGTVMGHCVGRGYDYLTWPGGVRPDEWDHDEGIWSLRDQTGRSRVTVEIRFDGIVQAQGPGNERPDAEVVPAFETLIARFVKPGFTFDVPYWLVREESGATHLRTEEEARADWETRREQLRAEFAGLVEGRPYDIPYGQIMFRPAGGDTWGDVGNISLQPTRRVRYARRGATPIVEEVVTSLEAQIPIRVRGVSALVQAMSRMADAEILDAALGVVRAPEQAEEIRYTAPAISRAPSRRDRHEAGQPWYRQHERQRNGRAAR